MKKASLPLNQYYEVLSEIMFNNNITLHIISLKQNMCNRNKEEIYDFIQHFYKHNFTVFKYFFYLQPYRKQLGVMQ